MAAQFRARNGALALPLCWYTARSQLLSSAALPQDEDGNLLRRHPPDVLASFEHRLAGPDEGAVAPVVGGLAEHERQTHAGGHVERLADDLLELLQVERLVQVVEGAQLHGLDGGIDRLRSGDEDDRDPRVDGAYLRVDREAGSVGQIEVEEDDVGRRGADLLDADRAGGHGRHPVIGAMEGLTHLLRQARQIVVDQEHVRHALRES